MTAWRYNIARQTIVLVWIQSNLRTDRRIQIIEASVDLKSKLLFRLVLVHGNKLQHKVVSYIWRITTKTLCETTRVIISLKLLFISQDHENGGKPNTVMLYKEQNRVLCSAAIFILTYSLRCWCMYNEKIMPTAPAFILLWSIEQLSLDWSTRLPTQTEVKLACEKSTCLHSTKGCTIRLDSLNSFSWYFL